MKEEFIKYYRFIGENGVDEMFKPVEKTCTFAFENETFSFSVNLNEAEMRRLVGECVKAFGLKAVINAASRVDEIGE